MQVPIKDKLELTFCVPNIKLRIKFPDFRDYSIATISPVGLFHRLANIIEAHSDSSFSQVFTL